MREATRRVTRYRFRDLDASKLNAEAVPNASVRVSPDGQADLVLEQVHYRCWRCGAFLVFIRGESWRWESGWVEAQGRWWRRNVRYRQRVPKDAVGPDWLLPLPVEIQCPRCRELQVIPRA